MEGFSSLVVKNLQHYKKKTLIALRRIRCAANAPILQQPIFIIGCSRAGTTLVYKTFSESAEIGSLQKETHDFWTALHPLREREWNSHAIPKEYACETDRECIASYFFTQTGSTHIVDKNNQNGLSIPYLSALFPDAHFVFIKRSPGDNIGSLIQGWGKYEEYGAWSENLPEKVNISEGKYSRWCFFLADGWRQYAFSPIEEVCAFQYVSMNKAILSAKNVVPAGQWHELFYEQVVNDPVGEFEQVFKACNLTFNDDLRHHCSEVISKPYNAFSEVRIDKWKTGEDREKIERILPAVKETAENLGYSI